MTLDLLRRRIDAAGGEPERIASLALTWPEKDERFTFETIRHRTLSLCCAIRGTHNVRLLVIDNLEAWAGNCHEPPSAALLGFLLTQLTELATMADLAIVVLARLPRGGGQAAARKLDQLASLAPVVYLAASDPDRPSRKLLLPVKNSLAPPTAAAFEVVDGHLVWQREPAGASADEFIAPLSRRLEARHERQLAARWLLTALTDGPLESRELFQQARDCGISARTLRRAAGWLGLSPHKTSFNGPWQWQLGDPTPGASSKPTQVDDEPGQKNDERVRKAAEPAPKSGKPEASASKLARDAAPKNMPAEVSVSSTHDSPSDRADSSLCASDSHGEPSEGGQLRARPIVRHGRLAPCGA